MTKDIVIVPTYDRPEMLWLCLEHLTASRGSGEVRVKVYVDAHEGLVLPYREEIARVVKKFPKLRTELIYRQPHSFHGNSFNVLMAYKEAYESDARYVFMVEDDILVQPDFFEWHRTQHAQADLDCSVGVEKRPEHAHYASLGVCFRRQVIAKVLPHCRPGYFGNMTSYCRSQFKPSKWHCEQDGVWCRVLDPNSIAWPTTPVAHHVGWYGYHRQKSVRPKGTLEERYQQVRGVLQNPALLSAWSRDFVDVTPVQDLCN